MWVRCGSRRSFGDIFLSLQALTFQKIHRIITAVDSQPMFDGGVLINVLGRLQVSLFLVRCEGKESWVMFDGCRRMKIRLMLTSKRSYWSLSRVVFMYSTIRSVWCCTTIYSVGVPRFDVTNDSISVDDCKVC